MAQTTGRGPRGEDITTPVTIGTVQAKIEPLTGRKLEIARQLVSTATHEITIWYLDGVVPECTVTYGARTFNVGAVRNILETGFIMVLTCTEKQ